MPQKFDKKKNHPGIFIGSVKLTDGDFAALCSLDMACSG